MKNIVCACLSIFIALGAVSAQAKPEQTGKTDAHKEQQLPQGLQKKVERDGELPPGWQRKLEVGTIMDKKIYEHSKVVEPLNEAGELTVEVEGKTVRMIEATREILDILK